MPAGCACLVLFAHAVCSLKEICKSGNISKYELNGIFTVQFAILQASSECLVVVGQTTTVIMRLFIIIRIRSKSQ